METLILNLFSINQLITGIIAIVLSLVLLIGDLNDKNKKIRLFFGLMTIFLGLWSISYYFWLSADSKEQAFFWIGLVNIGSTFIPIVYYHWIIVLLNKSRKIVLFFGYLASFIFSLFSFSSFYFVGLVSISVFPYWPEAGSLYIYYVIFIYFGLYVLGLFELIYSINYEKMTDNQKSIIKIILLAFSVSLLAGSTNFPLWFGIHILPYGNFILTLTHASVIIYAISKYGFMDTKMFYIQSVIGLIIVIAAIQIILSDDVGESLLRGAFFFVAIGFSFVLIKSFGQENKHKEELLFVSKKLERANKELQRLDKAKSEFISIASHQLRTPLTATKGYVSLILEGMYGKMTNETEDVLKKVFTANDRLVQLVEDLLNVTRIESGKMEFIYTNNVQVDDILQELEDTFILRAKDKGLEFIVKKPKNTKPITADKTKLREVISNLIDNAIKYTEKGFVHVEMVENNDHIKVIVEDSGVGISEESMKTLFGKFSRGTDDTKVNTEGTGLGLFVVKNLIEKQGGKIYAESEGLGRGSKFILEMPYESSARE